MRYLSESEQHVIIGILCEDVNKGEKRRIIMECPLTGSEIVITAILNKNKIKGRPLTTGDIAAVSYTTVFGTEKWVEFDNSEENKFNRLLAKAKEIRELGNKLLE